MAKNEAKMSESAKQILYVFSSSQSASINRFRDILHANSERQILSDIGDRYWFWIWAKLLAVVPSSKEPTSSEQIDGAKHIPDIESLLSHRNSPEIQRQKIHVANRSIASHLYDASNTSLDLIIPSNNREFGPPNHRQNLSK
jgi:hypothetical protein